MTENIKKEKKQKVKKEKIEAVEFMPDLKKRLEEKGLSETSIKLYFNNLRKLNDGAGGCPSITSFNFLENPEEIQQKISKLKPNTQKGYLTCIVSILNDTKFVFHLNSYPLWMLGEHQLPKSRLVFGFYSGHGATKLL